MDQRPINLKQAEFDAVTRVDFATFVERVFVELLGEKYLDNFHIHVLAETLEAVRRGEILRLAINLPPRNLKSLIISVAYVAWLLGHDPRTKIICASYGQELADLFGRQTRQVMQSAWYKRLFPRTRLNPDRTAADHFETTEGGFRKATSVGGVLTGLGADYIIIDDPVKPNEALSDQLRTTANTWLQHSVFTRLDDKKSGRIILVMQRLHEDDMTGYVMCLEGWKIRRFAAIATDDEVDVIRSALGTWTHCRREGEALHPAREPLEVLERYRRDMGPEYFSAQFQQAPVPPGGNMVKLDQLRRFDLSAPPRFEQYILSVDTANKGTELSSFSVFTFWGIADKCIYLIDVIRGRFEFSGLCNTALALARGGYRGCPKPDVILIEDKASGQLLIPELKHLGVRNIEAVEPIGDKVMRLHAQTGLIANGHVYVPYAAPWLDDFLQEVIAFPKGRYSDQVDSMSQALQWFNRYPDEPPILAYMREESERQRAQKGRTNDEDQIVVLRSNLGASDHFTSFGEKFQISPDGLFRMKWRDAQDCLKNDGWSLVEDAN